MRVLIDTNVLISAALSAGGVPFLAYIKAVSYPNRGLICEQNVDEMRRIFNKKFPKRIAALDRFLSAALTAFELVPVPADENASKRRCATRTTALFCAPLSRRRPTYCSPATKIF